MYQRRSRNIRWLELGAVLVTLTAGYLVMLRQFNVTELPSERHFGAIDHVLPAREVYLEPISIDALDAAMQLRAYISPSVSESKNAHSASDRDLTSGLQVGDIRSASRCGRPVSSMTCGLRLTPRGRVAP